MTIMSNNSKVVKKFTKQFRNLETKEKIFF